MKPGFKNRREQVTVKQWLEGISNTDTSTDKDSAMMENLLRRAGFRGARVAVGVVYLDGHGTLESPPTSIHSVAKMLLKSTGDA